MYLDVFILVPPGYSLKETFPENQMKIYCIVSYSLLITLIKQPKQGSYVQLFLKGS